MALHIIFVRDIRLQYFDDWLYLWLLTLAEKYEESDKTSGRFIFHLIITEEFDT